MDNTINILTFNRDDINAAIQKLVRAQKNASRAVETVLVMAVWDSVVNESAETANGLIDALRKSTKRDGIVAFLEQFGQLAMTKGKRGFVHFALGAQSAITWDAEYVDLVQEEAQNWESFKPASKVQDDIDVVKLVEGIVKKVNKAKENGDTVLNADLAEYLGALLAQYTAKAALAKAAATVVAQEVREAEGSAILSLVG